MDPEKFPSWERVDGAQRALGLSFVDIWRFSAGKLFHEPRRAAGRGRVRTAAPAGTTNVLNTRRGKRCATVIPTVRKRETAARTTSVCARYLVSCLLYSVETDIKKSHRTFMLLRLKSYEGKLTVQIFC